MPLTVYADIVITSFTVLAAPAGIGINVASQRKKQALGQPGTQAMQAKRDRKAQALPVCRAPLSQDPSPQPLQPRPNIPMLALSGNRHLSAVPLFFPLAFCSSLCPAGLRSARKPHALQLFLSRC